MTISEKELAWERERLERVVEEARAQLAEAMEAAKKQKSDMDTTRRTFWEDGMRGVADFEDRIALIQQEKLVASLARSQVIFDQEVRRLERVVATPYFGRIDFREARGESAGQPEQIYIGISSLVDRTGAEHMVYDWRAPISSLFYDAEPGPGAYVTDAGRIEGEVTLKRQYKVVDGELRYLFDTNVTIEDELLQEILSKIADRTMRNIVTTIQREQNRIIRDETHPLLVVQGPAGSGKTSVALHRIAYLMYRFRDELAAHNIVVISPSDLFSEYIAGVLPELGEENMLQTTFQALAEARLGKAFELESVSEQVEYLLTARGETGYAERVGAIRYKSSVEFLNLLKKYVAWIESGAGIAFADVVHDGRLVASAEELRRNFDSNSYLPASRRLEKLRQRVAHLVEPQMKALREQFEAELRIRPEYSSKAEIRWEARTRAQELFAPVFDEVARWASLDVVQCYAALFSDQKLFLELCGEAGLPEGFAAIREQTLAHLSEGRLRYEDIAPLLFLKNALEGVDGRTEIRHVVVDEAQDYSPCHYAVFRQEFPRARFTILGDLNQSIHPYMHVKRYEDVVGVYDVSGAALLQLRKSYRSTQEIVAFTKALLRGGEPVEAILRSGPLPKVIHLKDEAGRNEAVLRDVAGLQAQGMRSIALICKTEAEASRVHAQVGGALGAGRVRADGRDPSSGVVVIPAYLAKGLEFDAVLVVDAGASTYEHEDERKLLYTACTRALHRLNVYVVGAPSPLIAGIDPDLYENVSN